MPVYVFADTNIWLHFRPIAEIDWLEVLNADAVTFVVTAPLIRELDSRKNESRTRDRARSALRLIEAWANGRDLQIRTGVTGQYWHPLPRPDPVSVGLDPSHPDDLMIAFARAYADSVSNSRVVFLTDDLEPRLTAARVGLEAAVPPAAAETPAQLDEASAEIRRLRLELESLKNRMPSLALRIKDGIDGGTRLQVRLSPLTITRDEYRALAQQTAIDSAGYSPRAMRIAMAHSSGLPRWEREWKSHLERVADISARNWLSVEMKARTVIVNLELRNDGTSPARNTDITVHVTRGSILIPEVLAESRFPDPPEPPQAAFPLGWMPTPPWLRGSPALDGLRSLVPQPPPNVTGPDITGQSTLCWHVDVAKQNTTESLGRLLVGFASFEEAQSFTIEYSLNSESLPKPHTGSLHIIVERGDQTSDQSPNAEQPAN